MRHALAVACALTCFGVQADEVSRWDPSMSLETAFVDTNGVKWIDGRDLPIEGRVFKDVELPYDRLPVDVTTNVNGGVRYAKHHTSGMLLRLTTDSRQLSFKWTPFSDSLSMDHMPATGVSGIDVYCWDEAHTRWLYVKTGRITSAAGATLTLPWKPGTPFLVNFPLYNGLKSFAVGIDPNATVAAFPHRSGIDKSVVFYGTSITHGGCCSRPGLSFVNWIGRELDVPVVGLGFSGSGVMEYEMSEHLARIDASCYVLDCLWNMHSLEAGDPPGRTVEENYERFVRNLRARRPSVPIVMVESPDVYFGESPRSAHHQFKDRFAHELYERLVKEGWKRLHWLPRDKMFSGDFEGTVDGSHPNDLGMRTLATAYGEAVRKALWPVVAEID